MLHVLASSFPPRPSSDLAEGVSLYANRVEGLVPGATAAATANAGNGVLPVSNGGEVLSPFVSTQYELGGNLSLGKLNAGLALFQIDRDLDRKSTRLNSSH